MQIRQLDGVGDVLDLAVEAAHVGVGDVGHLLEHELLDLGPGQLLHQQLRARLHEHGVAGAQVHTEQVVGELDHPLLVGPGVHDGAPAVLEELLQGDDLTGVLALAGQDHVERLVEDHFLAPAKLDPVDLGVHGHPHLATAREDVDGPVVVGVEERPVGARGLGELVDLLTQRGDVLLGLLQGVGQLLVLGDGLGQLALGLEQPLLEGLDASGPLRQASAQDRDLLVGLAAPVAQTVELLAQRQLSFLFRLGRRNHLLGLSPDASLRPYTGPDAKLTLKEGGDDADVPVDSGPSDNGSDRHVRWRSGSRR